MKKLRISLTTCCVLATLAMAQGGHKPIFRGDGTFGYTDTPIQPWSGYRVHDPDRPKPKAVDPGTFSRQDRPGRPPSDAIVLFDGRDLSKWKPNKWKVDNGELVATEGPFETVEHFGSCQVHVEWKEPNPRVTDNIMDHGNNGVLLMGDYEIQIFDPATKIYPDGQAASVYGQTPPLVTAALAPGKWEVYDIIFTAPKFDGNKLEQPARVTVFLNGVLVQNNQEIYGPTGHAALPKPYTPGKSRGPLGLSAHACPVRFRNIWIRPF